LPPRRLFWIFTDLSARYFIGVDFWLCENFVFIALYKSFRAAKSNQEIATLLCCKILQIYFSPPSYRQTKMQICRFVVFSSLFLMNLFQSSWGIMIKFRNFVWSENEYSIKFQKYYEFLDQIFTWRSGNFSTQHLFIFVDTHLTWHFKLKNSKQAIAQEAFRAI
jgi:hypothetical protein